MNNYLTVPEELQPIADRLVAWFRDAGYKVIIENQKRDDAPFLVALECKRQQTTLLIDVQQGIPDTEKLREWTAYCKAQGSDIRYGVAFANRGATVSSLMPLKEMGVGILMVDEEFRVHEEHPPQDLSLDAGLPTLRRYPNRVRALLGPAWDVLNKGDFVQGFDDACVALESEARKYLARNVVSGRIHLLDNRGRPVNKPAIMKMTMGQLAAAFKRIPVPNHGDSSLAKILAEVNPTRIKAAHKRRDGRSVKAIKQKGPALLWKIAQGTELALK